VAGPARRAAHELAPPPGAPVRSCAPAALQAWTSELANSAAFVYTKAWLAALRKKLKVGLIFKGLRAFALKTECKIFLFCFDYQIFSGRAERYERSE